MSKYIYMEIIKKENLGYLKGSQNRRLIIKKIKRPSSNYPGRIELPTLFYWMDRYENKGYVILRAWKMDKRLYGKSRTEKLLTFAPHKRLTELLLQNDGELWRIGLIKPTIRRGV